MTHYIQQDLETAKKQAKIYYGVAPAYLLRKSGFKLKVWLIYWLWMREWNLDDFIDVYRGNKSRPAFLRQLQELQIL